MTAAQLAGFDLPFTVDYPPPPRGDVRRRHEHVLWLARRLEHNVREKSCEWKGSRCILIDPSSLALISVCNTMLRLSFPPGGIMIEN